MEICKRYLIMTYAYLRYSTSHQDEVQQRFALDEYASSHGLTIDDLVKDEGISGGVSYRERNLYKLVKKMNPGDILITTEISRLGRAMSDINKLLNDELKPRKLRLIVVKMGLDLDCSNLKAVDEMIIFAFGFSAQCEKEMIQQRTQSAIDARKEMIKKDGGFMSKNGNFCNHLGRKKGDKNPNAILAMHAKQSKSASDWKRRSPLYLTVKNMLQSGEPRQKILRMTSELYEEDPKAYGTRNGKKLCEGTLSRWASEILTRN